MSDIKRVNINGSASIINPDYDAKLNHTDASLFTTDALKYIAGYNPANGINMQNAVDVLAKKQAITPYVKDYSDSDLDIKDENGYVLSKFNHTEYVVLQAKKSMKTCLKTMISCYFSKQILLIIALFPLASMIHTRKWESHTTKKY